MGANVEPGRVYRRPGSGPSPSPSPAEIAQALLSGSVHLTAGEADELADTIDALLQVRPVNERRR